MGRLALNGVKLTSRNKGSGLCSQGEGSAQDLHVWERLKARKREGVEGTESRTATAQVGRPSCPAVAQQLV